jgi:hypothetical protein
LIGFLKFSDFFGILGFDKWSGRQDSNLRPSAPKADALPSCATPRKSELLVWALLPEKSINGGLEGLWGLCLPLRSLRIHHFGDKG